MSWPLYWLSASVLTMTSAPSLSAGVQARLEAGGEALVVRQLHDVVDAVGARDLDRPVGGAVVDDEPLDGVEAGDLAREIGQRRRQRRLLVEAGDLDDELHARAGDGAAGTLQRGSSVPYTRGPSISEGPRVAAVPRPAGPRGPDPPHGERDAHPAAQPAARGCAPRRPAFRRARASPCSARGRHRVPGVPDLSQLRQRLLAAVGPRARSTASSCRASTPTARRPSTPSPSRSGRCCRSWVTPPPGRGRRHPGVVLRRWSPGIYRLARASFGTLVGLGARRPALHAASTTRSWPPAATSTSPTSRFVVWAAALVSERPRRGAIVWCC